MKYLFLPIAFFFVLQGVHAQKLLSPDGNLSHGVSSAG